MLYGTVEPICKYASFLVYLCLRVVALAKIHRAEE